MKFLKGKYYDNNMLSLLSAVLYNLKWGGVLICCFTCLNALEMATDSNGVSGSEEEYVYGTCLVVIVTILLFVYKIKWERICDLVIDKIEKKIN